MSASLQLASSATPPAGAGAVGAAPPAPAPKPKRSQFIEKLHQLLESPYDASALHWCADGGSFEITTDDGRARTALSPQFDFNSLSSFIRQLSYYNFKRLSDRRRSVERRVATSASFIVFSHPTGFFIRGDNTQLDGIIRKARVRSANKRRGSVASTTSNDDAPSPTGYGDGQSDYQQPLPSYSDGSSLQQLPYGQGGSAQRHYQPPTLPPETYAAWRGHPPPWVGAATTGDNGRYSFSSASSTGSTAPSASSLYTVPGYAPNPFFSPARRSSLSDYRVGGVSPGTKELEPHPAAGYPPPLPSPLGLHAANASDYSFPSAPYQPPAQQSGGALPADWYNGTVPPTSSVPSGLAVSFDPARRASFASHSTNPYASDPSSSYVSSSPAFSMTLPPMQQQQQQQQSKLPHNPFNPPPAHLPPHLGPASKLAPSALYSAAPNDSATHSYAPTHATPQNHHFLSSSPAPSASSASTVAQHALDHRPSFPHLSAPGLPVHLGGTASSPSHGSAATPPQSQQSQASYADLPYIPPPLHDRSAGASPAPGTTGVKPVAPGGGAAWAAPTAAMPQGAHGVFAGWAGFGSVGGAGGADGGGQDGDRH
ncbi:heat shock factor family protein [Rhodotorula paludigena]|uniref:heat shock factor family protein n=1 Tax=Rhodotorula paludigena TaxID=86838 RepID=UPI00316F080F